MTSRSELAVDNILYGRLPAGTDTDLELPDDHWWWPQGGVATDQLDIELAFEDLHGWSGAGGWVVRRDALPRDWNNLTRRSAIDERYYLEYLEKTRTQIKALRFLEKSTSILGMRTTCVFDELFDPALVNIGLPATVPPLPPYQGRPERQALTNLLAAVETVTGKDGRWWYLYSDAHGPFMHLLLYYSTEQRLVGCVKVNYRLRHQ